MINDPTRTGPGRLLCLFTMILALLFIGVPYANPDERTVKVGVYDNAPKIFLSESGEPSGIFIDIIEHIAKSEGWTLKYVHGTWKEGLERLAKGDIDLMPDVAYSAERDRKYAFHKVPALSAWDQVFARKDSGIQSILDLDRKRIVVLEGSVQQAEFTRMIDRFDVQMILIMASDYRQAFDAAARGKADAVVANNFYGKLHARKFGLEDTAVIFNPAALFFASAKGTNEPLLEAIDRYLREMKRDTSSAYYQTLKRWTAEEVRFKLPVWMQVVGLVAGIVLLVSVGGSIILKRQVNARTRALRASEKKYREIFENAVMGVYQSTPSGVYLSVNPAFAQMLGFRTPEELLDHVTDIQRQLYVHPEDRERFKRIMEEKGIVRGFEVEYKRRDGSHLWISLHGKAVRDGNGRILYYEGTLEDITTRKQVEKELAIYRENLETLVKERTAELEIAKTKAEEADRLKSAFLATMSHELRTPLNSIIGFTGIILRERVGPLNAEQKKQLNMVRSSSQHLLSLINDVLDISKIEAGQLTLAREEIDLRQVMEKAVQTVRPLADIKGLELTCEISPDITIVPGDRRRVEQVLLNLISNAIKFTEKGSVRVVCESDERNVMIRVIDTGIGIRKEDTETIFENFRQIDSGLSRKYEGTGLGLSISKKLVEMMGGQIGVTSVWGSGSTFRFSLPRERNNR